MYREEKIRSSERERERDKEVACERKLRIIRERMMDTSHVAVFVWKAYFGNW